MNFTGKTGFTLNSPEPKQPGEPDSNQFNPFGTLGNMNENIPVINEEETSLKPYSREIVNDRSPSNLPDIN